MAGQIGVAIRVGLDVFALRLGAGQGSAKKKEPNKKDDRKIILFKN